MLNHNESTAPGVEDTGRRGGGERYCEKHSAQMVPRLSLQAKF